MMWPTHDHSAAGTGGRGEEQQQHDNSTARPEADRAGNTAPAALWWRDRRVYPDLWYAYLAEYAHVVVAQHFHVPSHLNIEHIFNFRRERTQYVSNCWTFCQRERVLPERIIFLAPLVALLCVNHNRVEVKDVEETLYEISVDGEEEANLAAIFAFGYDNADIAYCLELVRRLWPKIVSTAEKHYKLLERRDPPARASGDTSRVVPG